MGENGQKKSQGWVEAKIGDVASLLRGISYKKTDARKAFKEGLVPLLRANNINNKIIYNDLVYLPKKYISNQQYLKQGDIVIAMSSGSKHLVGKAAQIVENNVTSFGAFCGAVRAFKEGLDKNFLGLYFQSKAYRDRVSALSKGSNINNLKRDHILEAIIPVAP